MDNSCQWNKLTGDLEMLVLTKLPLLDFRRLSFTCKYFNSFLSDPSFTIHYHRHRVGNPTLLAISPIIEEGMCDEVFNFIIWQEERRVKFTWKNPFTSGFRGSDWVLSTYGDGFLCFERTRDSSKFLVLNPLVPHECRMLTLPAMAQSIEWFHKGVAYDRKNQTCKLVLWRNSKKEALGYRIVCFVYNFKEGTWKQIPDWNGASGSYFLHGAPQLVLHDRFLCWLGFSTILNSVLVFDVEEDSWKESIPLPWADELVLSLAEHKRQLCVIRKIDEKPHSMVFGLWKFDREQNDWKLAESIPPPPIPNWKMDYGLFPLTGRREFLWFDCKKRRSTERCFWVYDMSRSSWQSLGKFKTATMSIEANLFRLAA